MALTLEDLFASPDHYLHSFDGDQALFVPMDRAAYHRSIFLDGRISPAGEGTMPIPVAALAPGLRPPQRTGWIFHVAHCGSTLLARALDSAAGNLVLREPLALRQTAIQPSSERLALIATMLGKRYAADRPTIVKANVPVNFILPQLAALDPAARAIFLHLPLRDYLLAILRSEDHRGWLRRVTTQLAPRLGDLSGVSDAERATALWSAQMRAFAAAARAMPNARSLNAETFFADPRATLLAAARLLGVPLAEADADRIVAGPLFATYSKNPAVAFDNDARLARRQHMATALAPELEQAAAWVERNGGIEAAEALERVDLLA